MSRIYTGLVLLTILITACSRNASKENVEECYNFGKSQIGCLDSIFSSVEIIPLQFAGDYYPGVVNSLCIGNNHIFIEDNDNKLYVFDSNGTFVSSSHKCYGMGPGEFSRVMGWSWNPYTDRIEILSVDRILKYDVNFEFVESVERIPSSEKDDVIYEQIYDCSATSHYLLPTGVSKDPCRVLKYDTSTDSIIGVWSYTHDVVALLSMQRQCFFDMADGTLLFSPPAVTYNVYQIGDETGQLTRKITFQPGPDWLSKSVSEGKSMKELMSSKYYIPLKTLVSNSHLLVMAKNGMKLSDMFYFSIDRKGKTVMKFKLYDEGKYLFPKIDYVEGEYAYAIMERSHIDESRELLPGNKELIFESLSGVDNETLLLLKYRFK